MKVKSIAECSLGSILLTCIIKAIISLENQFLVFFLSGLLRQVLLYMRAMQCVRFQYLWHHQAVKALSRLAREFVACIHIKYGCR